MRYSNKYLVVFIKNALNYCAYLTLLAAFFSLSGCDNSVDDDLSQYIYEVKGRKAKPIEPIPDFLPMAKFEYPENDNRRSPFKQRAVASIDKLAPNINRPKQPLESYPLDALKFVGILKQGSVIWGLISRPGGEIAKVKVGNYMGQNFGKVISITNTTLVLEESIQVSGSWERKRVIFNLKQGE